MTRRNPRKNTLRARIVAAAGLIGTAAFVAPARAETVALSCRDLVGTLPPMRVYVDLATSRVTMAHGVEPLLGPYAGQVSEQAITWDIPTYINDRGIRMAPSHFSLSRITGELTEIDYGRRAYTSHYGCSRTATPEKKF